jgi:hypothetical protein
MKRLPNIRPQGGRIYVPRNIPAQLFKMGECSILVSKDAERWHLSISHPRRYPTWDEILKARTELIPDSAYMVMCLPPKEHYVNLHHNCFHFWETTDEKLEWIMEQI